MKSLIRRIPRPIKRVVRGCYERLRPCFVTDTDQFLKKIGGLIHVGANIGQEREIYAAQGLEVLWIEPIPQTFAQLQENIRGFAHQEAVQGLVTDRDDSEYEFFVSDNGGESSSILPMEQHAQMWPEVSIVGSIMTRSVTLPTLLRREKMDLASYQALVLDTQGSELLVLKGAEEIIEQFRFIKIEVPDFQAYRGCVVDRELSAYMNAHGFREMARERFGHVQGVGSYWDIVFCRKGPVVSMKALRALLTEDFKDRHRWTWWRFRRLFVRPPKPQNPDGKIYLHLGCGRVNDPRCINIDAMPWPHVHHVCGVERLPMFADASADFVYVSHCLEHISFREVPAVLREWHRVLRPGGWLRVSVPDFDCILAMYRAGGDEIEPIEPPLLGGQTDTYNYHKSLYNRSRLDSLLRAAGFANVREWKPDQDQMAGFDDWSRKSLPRDGQRYPISLNLEGART
jgi:FkbM family methyltransferase